MLCAALLAAPVATASAPVREPLRAKPGGFLTAPNDERPVTVALDYVRGHPRTFELDSNDIAGLRLTRAYRSGGGDVHLQWEQVYRGIPVFGSGLRANVAADGQLINVGEGALPDPGVSSIEPRLSALDALLAAARTAGAAIAPGRPSAPKGSERATNFTSGDRASLTLFDGDRLAWRVLLHADSTHVYDTVVDASSGKSLYRVNMVKEAADDAFVFENYPGASVGGDQVTRSLTPWLNEPGRTRLIGPYAHVYSDDDDDIDGDPATVPEGIVQPGDEIPPSAVVPSVWTYPQVASAATSAGAGQRCPAAGCTWDSFDATPPNFSWTVNRNQAGTQLFYYVNRFHDYLRDASGIGFNAASGAYEGPDAVQAQVDDGAATGAGGFPDCNHLDNAYAIPVPEPQPLLLQVYLWSSGCPGAAGFNDVNPADDAYIIDHEYTHGMTNRLVTDAGGYPALNASQSWAMDEASADWYSLDFLVQRGFQSDTAAPGELKAGVYENTALRSQPFDCPVGVASSACPGGGSAGSGGYTYGDYGKVYAGGVEPHADGEIWMETLWDLRTRMLAVHPADGVTRTRALVTDALRNAPANPSFLDMRNQIVTANTLRGYGDAALIWSVFAARGMGRYATTVGADDPSPHEDFSVPPAVPVPPKPPVVDTTRPKLSRASMLRKRFKIGARSAFRFSLSEVATVEIALARSESGRRLKGRCRPATRKLRKRPRCTRHVAAGSLVKINMAPGAHRIRFAGKLRGHALRAGTYRATVRATDPSGNRSRVAVLSFKLTRH